MNDLYQKKRQVCSILQNIKESKKISPEDKKLLRNFKEECEAQGLSPGRMQYYFCRLKILAEKVKGSLVKAGKKEIKRLVSKIENSRLNTNGKVKEYSEWTKTAYKQALRKIIQVREGLDWNSKKFPSLVDWFRVDPRKSKLRDPTILTRDEILRMVRATEGSKEKALALFMYESGCRTGELLNLKICDVKIDENVAKVKLRNSKTGEREIILAACVPRLKDWLKAHPSRKNGNLDKNTWLWVNEKHAKCKRMSHRMLCKLVKKWAEDVGIDKPVRPYNFRHSRYTHLATKWPTQQLYKFMGQIQESRAIGHYVRLNNEDVENQVLDFYGMKKKNKIKEIKPLFCADCGKQNSPEVEFCRYCQGALTEKAQKIEEEKGLKEREEVLNMLIKKLEPKIGEVFMEMFGDERKVIEKAKRKYPEMFRC